MPEQLLPLDVQPEQRLFTRQSDRPLAHKRLFTLYQFHLRHGSLSPLPLFLAWMAEMRQFHA